MERAPDLGEPPLPASWEGTADFAEAAQLRTRIRQLEQELIAAKRSKRAADIELVKLRSHLHELDQKPGIDISGYYRLGRILVEAATSFGGLLHLAPDLYKLARDEWRARPRPVANAVSGAFGRKPARDGSMISQVHVRARTAGHEAAACWVLELGRTSPKLKARLLMEIARFCRATNITAAIGLARQAVKFDSTAAHMQWLAFALHDAGWVTEPAQLIRQLREQKKPAIGVQAGLAARILTREELLNAKAGLPAKLPPAASGDHVFLLAADILPLRWSLSACRFHLLALALQAQGRQVIVACLSRAGSAQPRPGHVYETEGVRYAVLGDSGGTPVLHWLNDEAQAHPAEALGEMNIGSIIASSQLAVLGKAMKLTQYLGCRLVIDDEGDEAFAAMAGIAARETEFVQLTRQRKQDFCAAAHGVTSPWRLMPVDGIRRTGNPNLRDQSILHGRQVIGFIGGPAPEYDFVLLLEAFQHAAVSIGIPGKPALLMAGVGRFLDLVEERLVELGWDHDVLVLHRPRTADLAKIYSSMDLFLAPTIDNAGVLDRPPIEVILALRFGVPVVAGDSAAARQWKAAGLPIVIAGPADAKSLGSTARRLLTTPQPMADVQRQIAAWNAGHAAGRADGL